MIFLHQNNNELVRKLDITFHENQISKNIIKNQEHNLIGLKKALTENEKLCKITHNKIDQ